MKFYSFFRSINKTQIFILLGCLYCLINILISTFVIDDQIYYNSYGEQISIERIDKMIQFKNNWEWITYIIIPISLLLKYSLVGLCIMIGVFFSGLDLSFKKAFQIVMFADIVLLLGQFVKIILL